MLNTANAIRMGSLVTAKAYLGATQVWPAVVGPPWTPAAGGITGTLSLWFDASDAASVTHSANAISQVNDKSGRNLHIVQATAAIKPTYVLASQNGLNAISHDGGDYLSKQSGVSPSVPRQTQTTFVMCMPTGNGVLPLYWTTNGSTIAGVVFAGRGTSGAVRFQGNTNNWANVGQTGTAAWSLYSGYILAAKRELFIDGTLGSTSAIAETLAVAPTQIWIGSSGGVAYYLGLWGEFIQYDGELSVADRQKVEGYSAWKWGTQALLPAGHPYKSARPSL